jgi:hypothetical protein
VLTTSKLHQSSALLTPLLRSYQNITTQTLSAQTSWENKPYQQLYWRGAVSGGFDPQSEINWRDNHRTRLHLRFAGPSERDAALRKDWNNKDFSGRYTALLPQGKDGYEFKSYSYGLLSGVYTNISLVGKAEGVSSVVSLAWMTLKKR